MGKLCYLSDQYIVVAGDVAAAQTARAFIPDRGLVSVSGITPVLGEPRKWKLRRIQVLIMPTGAASMYCGVRCQVLTYALGFDVPTMLLLTDYQHASHTVSWSGNIDAPWGWTWTVAKGGVVAGDDLRMRAVYEVEP